MSQLLGKKIALMISDPWDFGTKCGVGPFYGTLTDSGTEIIAEVDIQKALIALDRSINYLGAIYDFAICHIRHECSSLSDLQSGATIAVNITLLPIQAKTFSDISPDDLGSGFAAIGSLSANSKR